MLPRPQRSSKNTERSAQDAVHSEGISLPVGHRSPAHCTEWAKLIAWESQRPGEDFDANLEEHNETHFLLVDTALCVTGPRRTA